MTVGKFLLGTVGVLIAVCARLVYVGVPAWQAAVVFIFPAGITVEYLLLRREQYKRMGRDSDENAATE